MFKLYYASAIDTCQEKAFKQIEEFKGLFYKYTKENTAGSMPKNPIEVYGAGFNDSPIIPLDMSKTYKGVLSSYDLRKIRECDALLVVTDLKQFCAGTMMELEYARNLGIYTIIFAKLSADDLYEVRNIFLETYANKIIYSMEELEEILKDLTQ